MAAQRLTEAYRIVERYEVPGKDVYLTAYRFRHSGDPVTQAAIVFLGADGYAYLLEVTGHQDDETLLLSAGTGRRYPLTMVCEVWRVARSTVYAMQAGSVAIFV